MANSIIFLIFLLFKIQLPFPKSHDSCCGLMLIAADYSFGIYYIFTDPATFSSPCLPSNNWL
mgnify:CR=1 FL=1